MILANHRKRHIRTSDRLHVFQFALRACLHPTRDASVSLATSAMSTNRTLTWPGSCGSIAGLVSFSALFTRLEKGISHIPRITHTRQCQSRFVKQRVLIITHSSLSRSYIFQKYSHTLSLSPTHSLWSNLHSSPPVLHHYPLPPFSQVCLIPSASSPFHPPRSQPRRTRLRHHRPPSFGRWRVKLVVKCGRQSGLGRIRGLRLAGHHVPLLSP